MDLQVAGGDSLRVGGTISNLQQDSIAAWVSDLDEQLVFAMAWFVVVDSTANKVNGDRSLGIARNTEESASAVEVNDVDGDLRRSGGHA